MAQYELDQGGRTQHLSSPVWEEVTLTAAEGVNNSDVGPDI